MPDRTIRHLLLGEKRRFTRDATLKRAFVRSIEIIGKASKQIPDDLTRKYRLHIYEVVVLAVKIVLGVGHNRGNKGIA
jgi:uncharacterized protein with HEPN domain